MDKPRREVIKYYDYNDAISYIRKKYELHHNLWDFIIDYFDVHNGSYITVNEVTKSCAKKAQDGEMIEYLLAEFGEIVDGGREVTFEVGW